MSSLLSTTPNGASGVTAASASAGPVRPAMYHAVAYGRDQDVRDTFAARLERANQTAHANPPSAPDAAQRGPTSQKFELDVKSLLSGN